MRRAKVYVINNSGHDYSEAEQFGDLVYLTTGEVSAYKTNLHYRMLAEKMKDAQEGDFILVTGLASINAVAGWIIGSLGVNLRLLLFKNGYYLQRCLLPTLLKEEVE